MTATSRSSLMAACRHLQRARREIRRGSTWPAVVELADGEHDLGVFLALVTSGDDLDRRWRRRYLLVRAAGYSIRADIRLAIEADDDVFSTVEERENLVLDIVRMLQPLGIADVVVEERARQIALLFLLELAYRRIGGRRARAAAVGASRAIASAPPANDVPPVVEVGRS